MKTYRTLLLSLSACCLTGALAASELSAADPYDLNRAGRWHDVIRHFKGRAAARTTDRYILARAHDKLVRRSGTAGRGATHLDQAFRYYLATAGIRCRVTAGQDNIRACLKRETPASKNGLIERLALLRAAELAEKFDYTSLPQRLQLLANLAANDPLSRKIYQNRLKHLLDNGTAATAAKLAAAYPKLDSPLVHLYRARAFARAGQIARGRQHILRAGESTATIWIQKAVYGDVKKNHGGLLSEASLSSRSRNNRRMIALARYMNFKQLNALKRAFPAAFVVTTSTTDSVQLDGMFLIRSGQAARLPALARKHRNFLTMEPSILYSWVGMLKRKKAFGAMSTLYREFPAAKREHFGLWRENVRYLKNVNRDRYILELLDFLNYFGANYSDNDRLITFLIGDDTLHVKWADERYWKLAYKKLQPHTWNGRFLYWLRRYHLEHGQTDAARKLTETFYERAPGSYYATAFWSKQSGDYARDWRKVLNRKSYMWWISRHGGNLKAVNFIARKNLQRYLDPQAVAFWSEMSRKQYRIPGPILDLHYLGEVALGKQFYNDAFGRKLPRKEHLARRAYIGHKTGNLYVQVYFTRELLRANLIPEDPFSLPPGLLRRLYPRPYLSTVRKFAGEYRISSAMVYGLMRQESMFRETAISRSGARGLMQVMPRTGAWLQSRMKLPKRNLLEPAVSIQLGSKYMSDMLRENNGDFRWASIAYNGGPGNLRKWKKKYYLNDFNLFLEKLPVAEPRNYARITYQNYMHYRIAYMLYP